MSAKKSGTAGETPAPKRVRKKAAVGPTTVVPSPPQEPPPSGSEPGASLEDRGEIEAAELERIIVFGMQGQRYGLPIDTVLEIQQIVAISEVPDQTGSVVGVINLRGQVIPVIDLRLLLGMEVKPYELRTPMILTRTARGVVALIVDDVEDVVGVPAGGMQAATGMYALADRLAGVCRLESGMVFVFDIDALVPPALAAVGRP